MTIVVNVYVSNKMKTTTKKTKTTVLVSATVLVRTAKKKFLLL